MPGWTYVQPNWQLGVLVQMYAKYTWKYSCEDLKSLTESEIFWKWKNMGKRLCGSVAGGNCPGTCSLFLLLVTVLQLLKDRLGLSPGTRETHPHTPPDNSLGTLVPVHTGRGGPSHTNSDSSHVHSSQHLQYRCSHRELPMTILHVNYATGWSW